MLNEQSTSNTSCPDLEPDSPKHVQAERLTAWSEGAVQITFRPDVFIDTDDDSRGHLFRLRAQFPPSPSNEPDMGTLDDRRQAPLEEQIIAELRRMARHHLDAADRMEGKLPIVRENLTTWSDRVSRLCLFAAEVRLPSDMRQIVHVGHESEINGYISERKASHPTEAGSIRKRPISWQLVDEQPQDDRLDLQPDPGAEDLGGKEVA